MQGKVLTVQKFVSTIAEQRMPSLSDDAKDDATFLADCVTRLQYFVKVASEETGLDGPKKVTFGIQALKLLYTQLLASHTAGTATADQCTPFIVFQYLLDDEMVKGSIAIAQAVLKDFALVRPTKLQKCKGGSVASGSATCMVLKDGSSDGSSERACDLFN